MSASVNGGGFFAVGEAEFVREPVLHDLAARYLQLAVEACLDHAIAYGAIRDELGDLDRFAEWGISKLG